MMTEDLSPSPSSNATAANASCLPQPEPDGLAAGLVSDLIDRLALRYEAGSGETSGLATGFLELDRLTTGMHQGDLIVLAGRPSVGKSALALNVAQHVAIREALGVIVFSLEMSRDQLMDRLISALGEVDLQRLRSGQLRDEEWGRIAEAAELLAATRLIVDDTPSLTMANLSIRAREHVAFLGSVGLIVVDYVQLMLGEVTSPPETRATQVGAISRGLKLLARELGCPVIALSQLNRSLESRTDKRPMMSDLRDSGTIEEDADVIIFLYRDDYYSRGVSEIPGIAEVIVGKQRNGPTGTVRLIFLGQQAKFKNLIDEQA